MNHGMGGRPSNVALRGDWLVVRQFSVEKNWIARVTTSSPERFVCFVRTESAIVFRNWIVLQPEKPARLTRKTFSNVLPKCKDFFRFSYDVIAWEENRRLVAILTERGSCISAKKKALPNNALLTPPKSRSAISPIGNGREN